MKRLSVISLIFSLLFILSCEDKKDTTPPEVTITSPSSGSTVNEVVNVTCMATDNKEVLKVELWVDGVNTGLTDETEPYSFQWNTTQYKDGDHTLIVRGYDTSDNEGDSSPLTVKVDNTVSVPNPVNITEVSYTLTEMTVKWLESTDTDFRKYSLLYSQSESGTKETIETYSDKTTISYTTTTFDPTHENWYWVEVADTFGYSIIGNGQTNTIDSPPTATEIDSITFDGSTLYVYWTPNKDADFKSLTVFESDNEDMSNSSVLFSSQDQSLYRADSYNHPISTIRYYQIEVEDVWGLKTKSKVVVGSSYITFVKTFGAGPDANYGYSVVETDDGYVFTGQLDENLLVAIQTDANGKKKNETSLNDSEGKSRGNFISKVSSDGGFIVVGSVGRYLWLVKLGNNTSLNWNKVFKVSSDGYDQGRSVKETADGGFIIVGHHKIYSKEEEVWLIKTDSKGDSLWTKTYGHVKEDYGYSIDITSDGGYIIVGNTYSDNDDHVYMIKTDSKGDTLWTKIHSEGVNSIGRSIKETSDGGFIIAGYSDGKSLLLKTDSNGKKEWSKTFGYSSFGYDVDITSDGGYVAVGYNNNKENLYLINFDSNGETVWTKYYGRRNTRTIGHSVKQTKDNGFIITGWTNVSGSMLMILMKTDPEGNTKNIW